MKMYHDLPSDVLESGVEKGDRAGTGTLSVFGRQFRRNLEDGFPPITTKKLHPQSIINMMIWFLSGDTNTKWLKKHGVSIWDEWAAEDDDLGPIYGKQRTAWPTHDGKTINQIDYVVPTLKAIPNSRRILFQGWSVEYLPDESVSPQENARNCRMALPPCHFADSTAATVKTHQQDWPLTSPIKQEVFLA